MNEKVRALVVDDNPADVDLIRFALVKVGRPRFDVQVADRLSKAIDRLRTDEFDVLLLDLGLPESQGLETLKTVRTENQRIPIVVLTGLDDAQASLDSLEQGAQDYLTKDVISPSSLGRSIRYAIQRQQLLDALEETRKQSEQKKFKRLLESAPDATVIVDQNNRITLVNYQTERLFGFERDEILGKPFELLMPGASRQDCVDSGDQQEHLGRRKDGTTFPAEIRLATVNTEEGVLVSAAVRDISERKQAELALREKEEQLRQSQKLEAVGTLAGGVAHEFNNLLQAIQGYTKFAIQGLPENEQRYQDLQQVLKASERASTLTRQLLDFGRRQTLQPTDLDPNEIVHDLLKLLRPLIGEHIELQTSLDEDAGFVHADPTRIQQMLMNLCLNARDAMPDGGKLFVKTEAVSLNETFCKDHIDAAPGRYVLFSVSDTGCGMSPEIRNQIFEPFFTTKEIGQGTGLGLAMVYGVVQQHAGLIKVNSDTGSGTAFEIYLPTTNASSTIEVAEALLPVVGGNETILIAEDEPMVRDLAARVLKMEGYTVLTAKDGEEAVSVFEANAADVNLLLLDMVMPKKSGHQVYEAIQLLKPESKVVFCSGYDPNTDSGQFTEKDGVQFIQKPFDPSDLLRKVREVLDRNGVRQAELATT